MVQIPAPFVAGSFTDPDRFIAAVEASTARGHVDHDGVMPYPIHGFDASFGFKRSWIGRVVLAALLGGAFIGFMFQFYTMKVDWPLILAGKPYNSWPAFVVVTFESGILLGALTNMFLVVFIACRLFPRPKTEVLLPELTDDTFAICIPVAKNGSEAELKAFLEEQGATDIAVYVPSTDARAAGPGQDGKEAVHV